jgi:hypothetical protein
MYPWIISAPSNLLVENIEEEKKYMALQPCSHVERPCSRTHTVKKGGLAAISSGLAAEITQ